jgi:oligopeptide transport system substrate-binding protein
MFSNQRARRNFRRARFLFLLPLVAFAFGCSRQDPPADLVIINNVEPESLDPAVIVAQADARIVNGIFEGLTRFNAVDAHAEPALASSWEISPDGKIYTFHLRTNLLWSTGEPITSADVVYSWLRALDPKTACRYAGQLYYLKNGEEFNTGKITNTALVGVSAPDKFTVRAELRAPTAFFPDLCAFQTLAVVPQKQIEKFGDRWLMQKNVPVSGAFELVEWRLNDKIRFKKNPNYWDAANTKSYTIDILPVGMATTALNLYERGQVDVVWDKNLIPNELIDVLLKRSDFHTFSYLGTYFIRINVTKKPFNDPRVRKALALAIDKERIVKKITRAGEQPTSHLVPPDTHNYTSPEGLGYDPQLARKLLAEAGFPAGKNFPRFEYLVDGSSQSHENIGIEIQQMWHDELGLQVDIRKVETQVFWGMWARLEFDVSRAGWIGDYNDANTYLGMFVTGDGNNETGWSNAHYDELIREANEQTDIAKREKIFQEAETILIHDELPIIPLYIYTGVNYFDTNKVAGIWENALDEHPLQNIYRIKPKP